MKAATGMIRLRIAIISILVSMVMIFPTLIYATTPEEGTGDGDAANYQITLIANNGTEEDVVIDLEEGDSYILEDCHFSAPEGYVFRCWDTSPYGNGGNYFPGAVIEANDNLTLYAIWDEAEPEPEPEPEVIKYNITLVSNNSAAEESVIELEEGEEYVLPDCPFSVPEDYEFRCWDISPDGNGGNYFPGAVIEANEDRTFYAIWDEAEPRPDSNGKLTVDVVKHYGADNKGNTDSSVAINNALKEVMRADVNSLTVVIPKGTYILNDRLNVWSNTTIEAYDATITGRGIEGSMVRGVHSHDGSARHCVAEVLGTENPTKCGTGGYNQVSNVTIKGGVWDAGAAQDSTKNTQCIQFRHAQNIILTDLTVQNSTNHLINLAATKNVVVKNVTCKNARKFTGSANDPFWSGVKMDNTRFRSIEAIHLDFANKTGEKWMSPRDGTPVDDITVTNCRFENVFAGVGTHHVNHDYPGKIAKNIKVTNNTFINLKSGSSDEEYGNAFYMKSAQNVTVTGNTITNAQAIANLEEVSGIDVSGNTITGSHQNAVYLRNCSGSKNVIKNNSITCSDADKNGIWAVSDTKTIDGEAALSNAMAATISNNTVKGSHKNGIGVEGAKANLTVTGNTIEGSKASGIYALDSATLTANGNTINNPGTFGILAEYNAKALVLSNTVNNSKDKAIFLNACASGSTVNNNTVNNPKQYGIFIYDAQGEIANNVISGNKVNNAVNWAIYVSKHSKASCNATIKNNTVTAPKHYGIFANNATVKISGNKVSDGKNDGIWLSSCTNSSVSGNTVERDAKRGIGAYNSNNITISNNTVKDAVGHGIYFGSASGKTVKATVSGNVSVSKYTSNKDIIVWDHAKYCVVKNNTYGKRGLSVQKGSCSTNSGNAVAAFNVTLSTTNYNYDGNVKTPAVTVKYGARVLTKDTHYTVKYAAGRKDVGRYSVTVTFKGGYSGTKTATFKINPKGTSLGTLTPASKKFTAHWTAQKTKMSASEITGYEIQYSTSKNFKSGVKTARVKGVNSHAAVIAKLGAKRNYYVRIRTYETVNHVDCFSTWSKVKTVKTK